MPVTFAGRLPPVVGQILPSRCRRNVGFDAHRGVVELHANLTILAKLSRTPDAATQAAATTAIARSVA